MSVFIKRCLEEVKMKEGFVKNFNTFCVHKRLEELCNLSKVKDHHHLITTFVVHSVIGVTLIEKTSNR